MGEDPRGDFEILTGQLGRIPTVRFDVIVRCHGGHPLVIRNHNFDADGNPFPNLYWLTCPEVSKAVARLESEGAVGEFNRRLDADEDSARTIARAHAGYARERARNFPEAEAWGGVGGTRKGVKCLHAHCANYLAGGTPFGPFVSRNITPDATGRPAGLTRDEFIQLLRTGHDPDDPGELLQVMPWPVYGKMVERDLSAVYEYLSSIPHAETSAECAAPPPPPPAR